MKLKTIKVFIEDNPSFTEGGIRHLIFHENNNGLKEHDAIIRIGRKVLIDEPKFFDWVLAQNKNEA